jgi:pentatricopeptide repeat protein
MPEKVLEMFDTMSVQPDEVIGTILFNACAKVADPRAMKLGKRMLTQPPAAFFDNSILMNSATDMLMKFGEVHEAEQLFKKIKRKNSIVYGAMMQGHTERILSCNQVSLYLYSLGYITNNMPMKALDLYNEASSMLDANLYAILYSACAGLSNERAITLGKQLLDKMPKMFEDNLIVMGSAIHMLMKFGEVQEAERLFSQIKQPNAAGYGAIMNGYNINGLPEKALDLFDQVSSMLNVTLYIILYSTCAALSNDRAIMLGKQLLNKMSNMFEDNSIVMGSAIHMLMKFGEVQEAERLFSRMKKRDAASYGVMMNGYNLNSEVQKCLKLFEEAKRHEIKLDEPMCVSLVGACSKIGMISICRSISDQVPKYLLACSRVQSCLVDMWVSVVCIADTRSTSYTLLLIRAKQVPSKKPNKCFNRSVSLPWSRTTA